VDIEMMLKEREKERPKKRLLNRIENNIKIVGVNKGEVEDRM